MMIDRKQPSVNRLRMASTLPECGGELDVRITDSESRTCEERMAHHSRATCGTVNETVSIRLSSCRCTEISRAGQRETQRSYWIDVRPDENVHLQGENREKRVRHEPVKRQPLKKNTRRRMRAHFHSG